MEDLNWDIIPSFGKKIMVAPLEVVILLLGTLLETFKHTASQTVVLSFHTFSLRCLRTFHLQNQINHHEARKTQGGQFSLMVKSCCQPHFKTSCGNAHIAITGPIV